MKPAVKLMIKITLVLTALCFMGMPGLAHANWSTFKTVVYTGSGETQQITGVGFKPDLVWIKQRNGTYSHHLMDSVRGTSNGVFCNLNTAQNNDPEYIKTFDSDGFTVGTSGGVNVSGGTYVAWCWKAGDSLVTNTDGSIASTVSVDPDAGFSIVKYTGNGTAGATIGHGVGAVPKMVIIKDLNNTNSWLVYHEDVGNTRGLYLDQGTAAVTSQNFFNNTSPSGTDITLGASTNCNGSGREYIAYVWTETTGTSSFGSYTGNGNFSGGGPEINCGFQPAYLMVKASDDTSGWYIWDNRRDPSNPNDNCLWTHGNWAEDTNPSYQINFTATGFKVVPTSAGGINQSDKTYIYMTFAEQDIPEITFSSDKTAVDYSTQESATLSWDVSFADTVTLEPGIGAVDLAGTASVTPTGTTTYTLTAAVGENTISEQVTVNVINGFDQGGKFTVDGKVGIGVLNPQNALEVNGTIRAREVIVTTQGWADYVFNKDYDLQDLDSVENYILKNRHLPGIPSADQLESRGLSVSGMLELQMKKIEELTFYIIELSKENKALEQRLNALE